MAAVVADGDVSPRFRKLLVATGGSKTRNRNKGDAEARGLAADPGLRRTLILYWA